MRRIIKRFPIQIQVFTSFLFFILAYTGFAQVPSALKLDRNMAIGEVDEEGIVWFDPRDKPFQLSGFEWMEQDNIYRRLPLKPEWEIRDAVDHLANHTAGGQVRFMTNSKRILVLAELRERSGMYHMPATGQSGFDLYVEGSESWKYVKTTRFPVDTTLYKAELYNDQEEGDHLRTFTLNFPLYNGVKALLIGLEEGSILESPREFNQSGKIVMYGTSITQGGCVSRPGMAYSNILSRRLDVAFVNLGFSGNGRGEPALARLINQIKGTSMIILDYEANANETITSTLGPFIDILRERHPHTPILVMSKIRYASAVEGSPAYELLMNNRDFQKDLVEDRQAGGDRNIYFLDGSTILGDDYFECTVDGSHPSDLGSYRIAEAMRKVICKIMEW